MNYDRAAGKLASARSRSKGKPYGSSTRLIDCTVTTERYDWTNGGTLEETFHAIGVKYHNTVVVAIMEDGRYMINAGGWFTKATKERIEQAIGCRITCVGTSFDTVRTTSARDWRLPSGEVIEDCMIINTDWRDSGLRASLNESTASATQGNHWNPIEAHNARLAVTARYLRPESTVDHYELPQAHEFDTYTQSPDELAYDTAFSMRFDEMNDEAEKEMAEWSKMLKRNR